jgi:hypothetical protein
LMPSLKGRAKSLWTGYQGGNSYVESFSFLSQHLNT